MMHWRIPSRFRIILFLFASIFLHSIEVSGDAAILNISYVQEPEESRDGRVLPAPSYVTYCAAYNSQLSKLPTKPQTIWRKLEIGEPEMDLCSDISPLSVIPGAVLAVPRHNCSAYDQGVTAQRAKTAGLILISHKMIFPGQPNTTVKDPSTFPILVMKRSDMAEIEKLPSPESWRISIYAVEDLYIIDGSGIVLIVIAVLVIVIGSYRSGHQRFEQIETAQNRIRNAMEPKPDPNITKEDESRVGVYFGSVAVIVFAVFMTGLLVLMYFFYDYLVYVFIALFVIGSTSGCYECFKPLLQSTEIGAFRLPLGQNFLRTCYGSSYLDIRCIFLFLFSVSLAIWWVMVRNTAYGWVLLDTLGSFLLVSILIGIQLPSLKSCTIFLSLLFIYDIFFVFITPLFTKDGQSVMIQVATGGYDPTRDSGGGQREVIPAAFKIPHIPTGSLCDNLFEDPSYSLLGFGDVMVPGFLISFLRSFELVTKIRPIYSISSCIAYLISLIVTTVALIMMRTGQPALLYIVPILLVTVFFIGWRRRELSRLWNGNLIHLYQVERLVVESDKPFVNASWVMTKDVNFGEV